MWKYGFCGTQVSPQRRYSSVRPVNPQDEFQMKYWYIMSYWNAPIDITYPTPPYISLREDIGLAQDPPPPRRRQFLDMIRKFNSNDIKLVTFGIVALENDGYSKVGKELPTSIRDSNQKWLVCENGYLIAKYLPGPEIDKKASFKISYYAPIVNGKKPITLKLESRYLSCQSGNLTLQSANDENLNNINSSNAQFLFFQIDTNNVYNEIAPATAPQSLVCTLAQNNSPVIVESADTNTLQTEFVFSGELYGSLLDVGQKRISLQPLKREMYFWEESQKCFPKQN
ncbi:uncharacterized protein LOC128491831 [Spea bombifrons]|uniref:uncharacterized protein LOC128491831 n=1 Tax=Spea bombifrons TaxID=233779 RepID=UPI00234A9367|nr:uncharacterized protein LOC128491831 [Spea bombifrons]